MSMDPKVLQQFMNATTHTSPTRTVTLSLPPVAQSAGELAVSPVEPQLGKVYTADTSELFPHPESVSAPQTTVAEPDAPQSELLTGEDEDPEPDVQVPVEPTPEPDDDAQTTMIQDDNLVVGLDLANSGVDGSKTATVSITAAPHEELHPETDTAATPSAQPSSEPEEEVRKDDSALAIYVRRVERRMNSSGPTMIYHRNICNRSLSYFLNDYRRVHAIDDEIKIQGVLVKATRSAGLWDEGGAVAESGSVLIVTDPNGDPLPPVKTDIDPHAVNGKHALVPVWPNCYVLMGGHHRGDDILGVYRITEVITQSEAGQRYPRLVCKLIASCQSGNVWRENVAGTFWTKNHPAVKAACRRMFEIDAALPAYVCPYREHFFDTADYTDCLADQEFLSQLQTFDTVEQGYTQAGLCLGVLVDKLPREHRALLTVSLNYFADQDLVVVFLFGVDYNYDEHTSKGGRKFYGRIVLHENDVFWYPDKTATTGVSYTEVKDALVRSGGTMVTTFRRMLPI